MAKSGVQTPSRQRSGARVLLKDVARHAGLSVAAVSMALRDDRDISDETKRRVRRIAEDLGYHRSRRARRHGEVYVLALRRTRVDTQEARLIEALAETLAPAHLNVAFRTLQFDLDHDHTGQRTVSALAAGPRTAVVLYGSTPLPIIQALCDAGATPVVIGNVMKRDELERLNHVAFENDVVTFQATRRLLQSGHDRVWLQPTHPTRHDSQALIEGYLCAAGERAAMPGGSLRHGGADEEQWQVEWPAWIVGELPGAEHPAVLCCGGGEDVYRMATEAGYRVPHDLSIVTIGGQVPGGPAFASWEPPTHLCGLVAGKMILDARRGLPPHRVVMPNHYVPGFSATEYP